VLEVVDVDDPTRRARLGTLRRAGEAVRLSDNDEQVLIGAGAEERRVELPQLVP
jgi:hypothetical protein